eukprot:gene606-8110_t
MYQEDERWIVKDLGNDGRNVNNWHWEEKNIYSWTTSTLESLFDGFEVKQEGIKLKITKVDSIKGESVITQRKGKLRAFYDIKMDLKWTIFYFEKEIKGKFILPEISQEEKKGTEIEIKIEFDKPSEGDNEIKNFLKKHGFLNIQSQLDLFIQDIQTGAHYKKVEK